jgi:hypothetical protein
MKKLYLILLFFCLIHVIRAQDVRVQIDPYLPKLYTWDYKKGRYIRILNRNGKICKNYPGGIFLERFYGTSTKPRYVPVHKPKGSDIKRQRRHS